MSAKTRRQEYKDGLRSAILNGARELFVNENYEGFSIRKLAEKIQYSQVTIYLHFKNKEDLFDCLVEESFAHLLKALEGVRDRKETDPVILIKKALRTYVE